DGVDISRDEFVTKMYASPSLPVTSQPSTLSFYDAYNKILAADPNAQILSLHIASGLSGTYQTASTIAQEDNFVDHVTVIDSKSIDRGLSFQVLEAAKMAELGRDVNEIVTEITSIYEQSKIYLSAETFKNLVAGGRLSKAAGAIATLLNIKVALEFGDNEIKIKDKGRGQKTLDKFYDGIIEQMKSLNELKGIGISYVDLNDYVKNLHDKVVAAFPDVPMYFRTTAPIVATHVGKGGVALEYFGK
ncbi:MAG: DegV family protein, partial [Lactobacillaceae bacterium]|nr:DegV family protein [Lactobacillaceae bacterium]